MTTPAATGQPASDSPYAVSFAERKAFCDRLWAALSEVTEDTLAATLESLTAAAYAAHLASLGEAISALAGYDYHWAEAGLRSIARNFTATVTC